jgi:hypothetical protein
MRSTEASLTSQGITPAGKVVDTGTGSHTAFSPASELNPLPVIVSLEPPAIEPEAGLRRVIDSDAVTISLAICSDKWQQISQR